MSTARSAALHAALLNAHAEHDQPVLVRLYAEAGAIHEAAGNIDAACYFWTQAYVFALECGDPSVPKLHARLKAHGREA